jgi:hypothetical protein
MSYCDDQPTLLGFLAVYDLKRVTLQQIETVPFIAQGIAKRVRRNSFQSSRKLSLEAFRSSFTPPRIPPQRISIIFLGAL